MTTEYLIHQSEVQARTGLSRSAIYARIKVGKFPAAVPLDDSRNVRWVASEIDAWVAKRIAARTYRA